ncbi:MAG TPA: cytochrome c [Longimicrobiaceae bacterium]|nr:cytochrome c [Longimicrobiaceae bacterium]
MQRKLIPSALGLAVLALTACGGGEPEPGAEAPDAGTATPTVETQTPPAGGAGAVQAANLPPGVTQAMVQEGQQIFTGAGICQTCHGPSAQGTALAPNLTDGEWINTDGSYDGIVQVVTNGVQQPKQHPAPMPPKGGSSITDEQVRAVAAYVYAISHPS